jgi:hypothetical protein
MVLKFFPIIPGSPINLPAQWANRKQGCSQKKPPKFLESRAKISEKSPIMELLQYISILITTDYRITLKVQKPAEVCI